MRNIFLRVLLALSLGFTAASAHAATRTVTFTGFGQSFVEAWTFTANQVVSETLVIENMSADPLNIQGGLTVLFPNGLGPFGFQSLAIQSTDSLTPFYETPGSGGVSSVFSRLIAAGDSLTLNATGVAGPATSSFSVALTSVPVPAAGLLFGSVFFAAAVVRRKKLQSLLGLPA